MELTLVIPLYNLEQRLVAHVENIISTLDDTSLRYEIIAVLDGSTDGSVRLLESVGRKDIFSIMEMPRNFGKGQALRVGLTHGRGKYLGIMDGDGNIPASSILRLLGRVSENGPHIISGSKQHPDAQVLLPPIRRLYSWSFQQLLRLLFHLSVRDTRTGLKLIRRDVVAGIETQDG